MDKTYRFDFEAEMLLHIKFEVGPFDAIDEDGNMSEEKYEEAGKVVDKKILEAIEVLKSVGIICSGLPSHEQADQLDSFYDVIPIRVL